MGKADTCNVSCVNKLRVDKRLRRNPKRAGHEIGQSSVKTSFAVNFTFKVIFFFLFQTGRTLRTNP